MVMGVSHPWYCMCKGAMVLLRERFGNHYDPKVQFTFSNLFGNTFEDLDDFKMYLHFVLVPGIHFWIPSFKGHLFGDSLF